jgi:hypothetical protein
MCITYCKDSTLTPVRPPRATGSRDQAASRGPGPQPIVEPMTVGVPWLWKKMPG